ncbi:MAG: FecR family protein [Pseudobacter sp.]|uniref:FecR family protein n=1 Tax=Pseudobacter sp. TaxID=2045420 RepID=UPI003F7DAFAF
MKPEQFKILLERFKADTLTQEEWEELRTSLTAPEMKELLDKDMIATFTEERVDPYWSSEKEEQLFQIIKHRVFKSKPVYVLQIKKRWWIAAAVLFALSIGSFLWFFNTNKDQEHSVVQNPEIVPGRSGATLTLADGSEILLDTVKNGIVALQGGKTVSVHNGTLKYEGNGVDIVYNTISTPNGRRFRLTLPDGSGVWLNNASSIRYPTVFGPDRKVEVTGEVYFEIAPDQKRPFNVLVNRKLDISVLGTAFNVSAFDNEASINTTLIEGKVKVINIVSGPGTANSGTILSPGQQAQLSLAQPTAIKVVNNAPVEKIIAWKEGLFNFNDIPFEEGMRQIARWYDIQIIYENGIPANIELNGEITMELTLNELLEGLRDIGLKFRLEGRKLIIIK